MPDRLTHDELVEIAAKWLAKKSPIVITEMRCGGTSEEPDAIGIGAWKSTLVECKTSRADLAADHKKPFRQKPGQGMGDERYILAEEGLCEPPDLMDGWGLLEVVNGKVRCKRKSEKFAADHDAERSLLVSAMRRLGVKEAEGVSVRRYTIETSNRALVAVSREEVPDA